MISKIYKVRWKHHHHTSTRWPEAINYLHIISVGYDSEQNSIFVRLTGIKEQLFITDVPLEEFVKDMQVAMAGLNPSETALAMSKNHNKDLDLD